MMQKPALRGLPSVYGTIARLPGKTRTQGKQPTNGKQITNERQTNDKQPATTTNQH